MKNGISFLILFWMLGCASKPLTFKDAIEKSIEERKVDFVKCYEDRPAPRKEGAIRVTFTIDSVGKVLKPSILKDSTLKDPTLETCVLSVLQSISFYPSPNKKNVEVTYPFNFSSGS